jgi:hypothetical protein
MKYALRAFLVFTTGTLAVGKAAEGRDIETGQQIEVSTEHFCLRIDADGKCDALIDLRDGKNYLADKQVPFASLICGDRTHDASRCEHHPFWRGEQGQAD